MARELTWWEVRKAVQAAPEAFPGIRRKKGESVEQALRRMSPTARRSYRGRLRRVLEALEERWEKDRRKP